MPLTASNVMRATRKGDGEEEKVMYEDVSNFVTN